MVWLAGAIVLVALMAFVPATRAVIAGLFGLGLLLLLLCGLYFWVDSMRTKAREERQQREAGRQLLEAASRIPPTALQFDGLVLTPTRPATRREYLEKRTSWPVEGRVRNSGAYTLSRFALEVTVQDCGVGEDMDVYKATNCDTIAQDTALVQVVVPPGQVRDFAGSISVATLLQGRMRWYYRVTATVAEQ